jgi:beta-mannosidase
MPWCQGSLIWQINDDWPSTTWSGIDYYGYWKAMHYWMRKSCENVMIAPYQYDDTLELFVVSDLYKSLKGTLELTLMDFSGKKLKNLKIPVSLSEWSSKKVATYKVADLLDRQSSKNAVLVCELKAGNEVYKALHYFEKVKDLDLPKPNVKLEAIAGLDGKTRIKVSTDVLAKNVMVMYNGEAGIFSDNFFDLLPGESHEITFMENSPVKIDKTSPADVNGNLSSVSVFSLIHVLN